MREILFRGKSTINNEWEYGVPVFGGLNNETAYMKQMHSYDCRVDPKTVGQYTELEDKNGKKIFEGDIVKITDKYGTSYIYVVEYYICALALKQKGVNFWAYFGDFHLRPYEIEVIGNIHDNPELIGGAEE